MEQDGSQGLPDVAGSFEVPRPTLTSLTVHRGDDPADTDVDVEVTLSWGTDWASGRYEGPNGENAINEGAAAATLEALHALLPDRVRFHLRWVGFVTADDAEAHEIVNVLVRLDTGEEDGEQMCIGAALTRNDARVAVVRATLDGINRRLVHFAD